MLCPDRRSLIIERGMRHAERRNEWRMCGKFCGLFIARRFQLLRVCCKEKKKEEWEQRERLKKRTEQTDWKQNKKTTVQCANKVKLNHVHTKCHSHSPSPLAVFFFWPHSLSHSHALYLCLCLCVCRFQHSPGAIWQLVTKATTEIPTNDTANTQERDASRTTWPHGSHFDIKD